MAFTRTTQGPRNSCGSGRGTLNRTIFSARERGGRRKGIFIRYDMIGRNEREKAGWGGSFATSYRRGGKKTSNRLQVTPANGGLEPDVRNTALIGGGDEMRELSRKKMDCVHVIA